MAASFLSLSLPNPNLLIPKSKSISTPSSSSISSDQTALLIDKFGRKGIKFSESNDGSPTAELTVRNGSSLKLQLNNAHLTSYMPKVYWKDDGFEEVLHTTDAQKGGISLAIHNVSDSKGFDPVDLSQWQVKDVDSDSIDALQVFKNHGASAGASMSHSHSQILGLPVVPAIASTRLDNMKDYYNETGKCVICDIHIDKFLIDESTHFMSIAPFASTFPFEIWIIPRYHSSHYHELDDVKAMDLGGLLKLTLQKLSLQLNDPPYNFMIHTSPLQVTPSQLIYTHWYIQIVPQLSTLGGFEMGTGCYINPVFPEDAAKILRELEVPNKELV